MIPFTQTEGVQKRQDTSEARGHQMPLYVILSLDQYTCFTNQRTTSCFWCITKQKFLIATDVQSIWLGEHCSYAQVVTQVAQP